MRGVSVRGWRRERRRSTSPARDVDPVERRGSAAIVRITRVAHLREVGTAPDEGIRHTRVTEPARSGDLSVARSGAGSLEYVKQVGHHAEQRGVPTLLDPA